MKFYHFKNLLFISTGKQPERNKTRNWRDFWTIWNTFQDFLRILEHFPGWKVVENFGTFFCLTLVLKFMWSTSYFSKTHRIKLEIWASKIIIITIKSGCFNEIYFIWFDYLNSLNLNDFKGTFLLMCLKICASSCVPGHV